VSAAVTLAALAAWAFYPLSDRSSSLPPIVPPTPTNLDAEETLLALDTSGFSAPIWNPAEAAVADVAAKDERVAPRLELELIGITEEAGVRRAALYDPKRDRLVQLAAGETYGGYEMVAVLADRIELSGGGTSHRLALREDRP
jgi:hypothetical protein